MFGNLKVNSWVSISKGCPMSYGVSDSAEVNFLCGSLRDGFEFAFDADALREFLKLGGEALQKMDALHAEEEAGQP
jgi:hypothetical protein